MKKKYSRRLSFIALIATFVLAISACGEKNPEAGASSSSTASSASASASQTASGGERLLTIGLVSDVKSFDVQDNTDGVIGGVFNNIFNYLVKRQDDGTFVPDLAESYEQVDDTTWRIKLKQNVTFHNGDPFTADDVKFSIERVATDTKLAQQGEFKKIKQVNVIDPHTVEFVTDGPEPAFLNRISRMGSEMLPKAYIEANGWDAFLAKPIGTGRYQFSSWKKDDRLTLTKYKNYFGGDVSDWDTIVFRTIPEASTRVSELLTGGVDMAADIPPADWERVNANANTAVISGNSTAVSLLSLKAEPGTPFADVRVRQAVDYAIDNKLITDKILKGTAVPTRTRFIPGVPGFDESLYNTERYDPEKAKQLLEEAGYKDGIELTLQGPKGRLMLDSEVEQAIVAMLEAVGIHAKLEVLESGRYTETFNAGTNKEIYFRNRTNSMFDGALALRDFYSSTFSKQLYYNSPEVDELFSKAENNMNIEERNEQFKQIQQIVADEVPYVFLYHEKYFTGINKQRLEFTPRVDRAFRADEIKAK